MPNVTVTAVRSFLFKGRQITKGESVTMPAIDASIEARNQNVSLARVTARSMKAEAPKLGPPTRRRRRNGTNVLNTDEQDQDRSHQYRRRDMTAEDPT